MTKYQGEREKSFAVESGNNVQVLLNQVVLVLHDAEFPHHIQHTVQVTINVMRAATT